MKNQFIATKCWLINGKMKVNLIEEKMYNLSPKVLARLTTLDINNTFIILEKSSEYYGLKAIYDAENGKIFVLRLKDDVVYEEKDEKKISLIQTEFTKFLFNCLREIRDIFPF